MLSSSAKLIFKILFGAPFKTFFLIRIIDDNYDMEELGDTGLPVNLSMRSLDYLKVSLYTLKTERNQ